MARRSLAVRILGYGIGLVLVIAFALAAWLTGRAIQIRNDLNVIRLELSTLQSALGDRSGVSVETALSDLTRTTHDARKAADDPLWRTARHIPLVGRVFVTTSGMVTELEKDSKGPLRTVAEVKVGLAPNLIRHIDGTIDVAAIKNASAQLRGASKALLDSNVRLKRLPDSKTLNIVVTLRNKLVSSGQTLAAAINSAADAADGASKMLGVQGSHRYFVGVQNNAELRGTGGAIAAYAILRTSNGKVTIEKTGPATELKDSPVDVVNLGSDYKAAWGSFKPSMTWSGSNRSADFPDTARNWIGLWQQSNPGSHLDGAIALDPPMLAQLVSLTGPVQLRTGMTIDAKNLLSSTETYVVPKVTSGARLQLVVQDVLQGTIKRVSAGDGDSARVASSFIGLGPLGHFMVYSTDSAIEKMLETTALSGALPSQDRLFAKAIVNNIGGTKLDYYLRATMAYSSSSCEKDKRVGHFAVTLRNTAPKVLPVLVTRRSDAKPGTYPPGQDHVQVTIYATKGATFSAFTIDGTATTPVEGIDHGFPIWTVDLTLDVNQQRAIVVDTEEPTGFAAAPMLQIQGMTRQPQGTIDILPCS